MSTTIPSSSALKVQKKKKLMEDALASKLVSTSIPLPIPTPLLDTALTVLQNNRKVTECKLSPAGFTTVYEPSALAAAKSLFMGGQVYRMLGVNAGTLTSSTTATLLTTVANNLSSFLEGTSYAALFDECRSTSVRLHLAAGQFSGAIPAPLIVGYNSLAQGTTTPPTAAANVTRLEGSRLWAAQSGTSAKPGYITFRSPPRKLKHPFCDTGTQYTLSPPSGTLGGFWLAQIFPVPSNIPIAFYKVECVIELRMRA
jgi:hypothetical protein